MHTGLPLTKHGCYARFWQSRVSFIKKKKKNRGPNLWAALCISTRLSSIKHHLVVKMHDCTKQSSLPLPNYPLKNKNMFFQFTFCLVFDRGFLWVGHSEAFTFSPLPFKHPEIGKLLNRPVDWLCPSGQVCSLTEVSLWCALPRTRLLWTELLASKHWGSEWGTALLWPWSNPHQLPEERLTCRHTWKT